MAETFPDKKDLEQIFRKLRAIPTNKVCFDCTAKIPTWASVTYGVFICIDCSAVHRSLGVHLTFVRSTQLDTNWTWLQIRQMQLGGNARAESFFQQHNCTTKDAQQKYNSRAAQLYKEKLNNAALQAMKLHGTKLHLDHEFEQSQETSHKEFDFFEDPAFSKDLTSDILSEASTSISEESVALKNKEKEPLKHVQIPSISSERKTIIGSRKPQAKKLGVGNKRSSGLGAQKSTISFAEVEKEAELSEKLKIQVKKENDESHKPLEPEQITSMRLAYEDLSIKQKKEEEKLKAIDPKKASQMERLGMGVGARGGISHSALSDMKTIHQENSSKFTKTTELEVCDFFDDFGFSNNSSFSSPYSALYKSSQSHSLSSSKDNEDSFKISVPFDNGYSSTSSTNNFDNSKSQSSYTSSFKSENNNVKRNVNLSSPSDSSTDAQKKFGGAKSISSDQYFSDSADSMWEQKSNTLSRFEGSTSISSADYFGRNEQAHQRGYISTQLQPPDLEEVRESVKQSVTKVAGRLSSLASGVISTIQDKYGGY